MMVCMDDMFHFRDADLVLHPATVWASVVDKAHTAMLWGVVVKVGCHRSVTYAGYSFTRARERSTHIRPVSIFTFVVL